MTADAQPQPSPTEVDPGLLSRLQTWIEHQQMALLHSPKDEALPALESRLPAGLAPHLAREALLRGGHCYVGRFLRGRSCLLSWAALEDCVAAVHGLPASDQQEWQAFLRGASAPRSVLTRWEQRLWIVRDGSGVLHPLPRQLPELYRRARASGAARGELRAVARFLLAAPRVDDKLLVSYLGFDRKRAKRCLRSLRSWGLCEPCGPGFVKGSLRAVEGVLRTALAQPDFPREG